MLPIKAVNAPLYVVTSISNSARYRSRYHLYREFEHYIHQAGGILYTVEATLGQREFEITRKDDPTHIQVRTETELWHKESLLNIGIQHLPSDWQYMCWIDADIQFSRNDWVYETLHLLQQYDVIQMFSQASDLDQHHRILNQRDGFIYGWANDNWGSLKKGRYSTINHPGYAWAATRHAANTLGSLLDFAIVGSADWHMASALVGQVERSLYPPLYENCPKYVEWCKAWASRANQLRQNVGYMEGLCMHFWHGAKQNRGYFDRWQILTTNKFDPTIDILKSRQNVWELTRNNKRLRDDLRRYFQNRDEDEGMK